MSAELSARESARSPASVVALPMVLRAIAVTIAVLAWIDPSYEGRGRPRVAVIDASAPDGLAAEITAGLAPTASVTPYRDPDADVWLVAARDQEAFIPAVPAHVSLSLMAPAAPAAALVVESLEAPARTGPAARVPVVATVSARGMRGATSTLIVRSGSLTLGRQTHQWTRDEERFTARFDVLLPRAGVNHLSVEASEGPGRSRQSRADTAIVVDAEPLPVLVYDGRLSWTTTFVRRVLEDDARFAVRYATRVSRGITASGGSPLTPTSGRLTSALVAAQTIVLVGAPETLGSDEVEVLRGFVTRGGALVLAPDQRPSGAYESLLWRTRFDERLLDEPSALPLADAPELALMASELVDARVLPAGARAVAGGPDAKASIWTAPFGRGRILFVGALDAWRFRGRRGEAFDRWWPQVVDWLGRDLVQDVRVECEPRAAAPGDPVRVRVRLRGGDAASTLRVALSSSERPGGRPRDEVLRVWPDAEPGVFTGVINAPEEPGVYAVSATSGTGGTSEDRTSQAPLIVDTGARQARRADDRWRLATAARGGIVAAPDAVDQVLRTTASGAPRERAAERRHPMRSLWWLLPFTACLGVEWQLRRRAGLR